ncbi:hypothetical protein SGLAM104S_02834 [Streptomyces glaucescens]
MTTGSRPRFSVRIGLAAAPDHDGPFEDVPEHLLAPLRTWVKDSLHFDVVRPKEEAARAVCLRLRIPPAVDAPGYRGSEYVQPLIQAAGAQLLDVVDEVLRSSILDQWQVRSLVQMLDDAGSAYRVNEAGDGLEERVTPAVRDAVRQTIADAATGPAAGSAADHLAAAWQAAYGRGPDPARAYSEAIKAVECAAHAVIQPNNAKATLGTMLGEIKNARHKFTAVIPSPGRRSDRPGRGDDARVVGGADVATRRPDRNRAGDPGRRPGRRPPRRRPGPVVRVWSRRPHTLRTVSRHLQLLQHTAESLRDAPRPSI